MLIFTGKNGFKIRCLIAVSFFVLSLIAIRLALPHFDAGVTKIEPSVNNGLVLSSLYFIIFPVLFFISSGIVLGSKIKGSLGAFFRFALTSVLVFLAVTISLLDYKSGQINASMIFDILRKFDKPARELIFPHLETLTEMSYVTLYYSTALFAGLAVLNLLNFASLARKVSKDVGALYNSIPDEFRK